MKRMLVFLALGFAASSALAEPPSSRIDPRVLEVMRVEKRATDRFCMSFGEEPIGNGSRVATECLMASANRYRLQSLLAESDDQALAFDRDVAQRQHAAFCAELGEYAGFGTGVESACSDWNRERSELLRIALDPASSSFARENQVRQVEGLRRLTCVALQNAGNRGRGEVFWRRISACFGSANFANVSDRAIVLEDF